MSESDKYKINVKPRVERVPLHMQRPMQIEHEPGWQYYVMNDVPGRREQFELAGWEAVTDKSANKSDKRTSDPTFLGNELKLQVNKRSDAHVKTATVMRIKQEFYDADQLDKLKMEQAKLDALNPGKQSVNGSSYGELKIERGK